MLSFLAVQFLTGLASACSLFLVASGLSIIFGVTRIVNFAHGAFYMLGAYLAYSLTERLSGPLGFWAGLAGAAIVTCLIGAAVEIILLRRIYRAPELFQLLATFGVTLVVEDLVVLIWGPEDLIGRRAPGLAGSVDLLGQAVPTYDLFLVVLGPAVLGLIWLLFARTRFGILVRAATQDRDMVAALGVNQAWLFTGVFSLGIFLAALGGALQLPRDAVNHAMDLGTVVQAFVVVVIGGLGSVGGAFVASLIVAEVNAIGILVLPTSSMVGAFAVMAAILVFKPAGLFGTAEDGAMRPAQAVTKPWRPLTGGQRAAFFAVCVSAALLPFGLGGYSLTVATELLIFALFASSLQLLISAGGLVSFGHAAYFGLGAYGAALATVRGGLPLPLALGAAVMLGGAGAALFGWFSIRRRAIYFAMLTLAFAQITWSVLFQWTSVTGGDNGVLGVWPPAWAGSVQTFYWLTLVLVVATVFGLRMLVFSRFGYELRALRDSELRAEAIGIGRRSTQWAAFVIAGSAAALAGALFAFLKGSVFPDSAAIPVSVDGLAMVLLGGVETVSGGVFGAVVYRGLTIVLMSQTDFSKLVLGSLIVVLAIIFPRGLVPALGDLSSWIVRLRSRRGLTASNG